jgi:RNA polymerase sigma factor (sigma-70 family)
MDDLEFVRRCVKGDKKSWDEFVDRYSRLIYTYIYSVLNTKTNISTQINPEDIFQEIFHSLIKDNFRKLKSFRARNGASLASWLRQVTINLTIDYIRKIKPAVSIDEETDDELSLKDLLTDDDPPVDHILETKEKFSLLKDCIDELDTDDKYFIELHINRAFRLDELKRILKISRPAVDMRKQKIIQRLRGCFRRKGFFIP